MDESESLGTQVLYQGSAPDDIGGRLLGDRIARLSMPVAGAPPVHWTWGVGS